MSPCVACKQPAFIFHSLRYSGCIFSLCIQIKIRMLIQPFYFICIQIIRTGFITAVCAITKNSIVTGKGNNSFSTSVRKIRMFLYKTIDQRNHIIIAYGNTAIIFHIFIADFSFLIYDKFGCKSVPVHIMIITHIILRKHKRYFTRRKENLPCIHIPIFIRCRHVINADHDISLIIHALSNLVKFINRCHNLIVIS